MRTVGMVCGARISHASDTLLVNALAVMPRPSDAVTRLYDFDYTTLWWDLVDECRFRQLLPDWEAWSRDRNCLQ